MNRALTTVVLLGMGMPGVMAQEGVSFHSPGLPPSRMDGQARLVEDWGAIGIELREAKRRASPALSGDRTS